MLKPDSTAKTTAPVLSHEIMQRERLFRLLDRSRGKPVVWITAPGGSGKTTLVASYLESRVLPSLWYQVDEKDADPAAFFYHMGVAAQECLAGGQEPLPLLTPEYLAGITAFSRRYFARLFQWLPRPFLIVFDNYQDVSPYAAFHEIVGEGLALIPPGVTVVALSRNEPPPIFAAADCSERFALLGWSDIRFTLPEAAAFARLRRGETLPEEVLERLQAKTDGWIAGLLLILEGMGGGMGQGALDCQMLDKLSLQEVFHYFAAEIFGRTDRETQEFLLKSAFVPGLTVSLAERLTGSRSAERILAQLTRNQFFTEKRSQIVSVYNYHPLFREFLLARAEQTFTAPVLTEIRRKAATLLEEAGNVEDAAGLFLEAADWESITDLIGKHGQALMATGRSKTLGEWLGRIPPEVIAGDAWLLYWRGVYLLAHNPAEARESLAAAFGLFKVARDYNGLFLTWSNITDTFTYEWKDFHPLDRWIAEFEELRPHYETLPAGPIKNRLACCMFCALLFRQPQHAALEHWKEKAEQVMGGSADKVERMFIGHCLVLYNLWMGRVEAAGAIVRALSADFKTEAEPSLSQLMWFFAAALYQVYVASFDKALETVREGLSIAEKAGLHLMDLMFLGLGVYGTVQTGDHKGAGNFLRRMEELRSSVSCHETINYHHNASLAAASGKDYPAAIRHAEECLALTRETGFVFGRCIYQYALACILLLAGEDEDVTCLIEEIRKVALATKSDMLAFGCWILEAFRSIRKGDDKTARRHVRRLLAHSRATNMKMTLFQEIIGVICSTALEAGVETAQAQDLIRRHHIVPDSAHLYLDNWPYPLRIYTLGSFEILKDDQPLAPASKAHKPFELLKALIALGGNGVSEARLIEALWPNAEGGLAHRSFDTTLHRLRKLIGNGQALSLQAGRLSLDPRHCWVDMQAFERLCNEIDKAWREKRAKDGDNLALLEKAAGLYRGHFLSADRNQPWTGRTRDRLQSRFRNVMGKVAGYWEERGEWEKAIDWYQRGIETDRLAEEFYQRLMLCYQKEGQTVEAARTYRRLSASLSGRLGLAPSAKTEEIYRAIVRKA